MREFLKIARDSASIVLRKGKFALAIVIIFIALYRFQIFEAQLLDIIALWMAALVFVAGLPLSALLRVDMLEANWSIANPDTAIALGVAVALLNWTLIALLARMLRLLIGSLDRALPKPPEKKKSPNDEEWSL